MKFPWASGQTTINFVAVGGMLMLAGFSLWATKSDHIAGMVVSGITGWLGHAAVAEITRPPAP